MKDIKLPLLVCLLYTAGAAFQYFSPAYFADLGHRMALDEAQAGSISAAESLGIGLASVIAFWWNGRVDRRVIALFAVISCVVGDIASFFCRDYSVLLLLRAATATFGEGPLFAMAFIVLAGVRNPDRILGLATSSVVLFTSGVFSAAPVIDLTPMGSGWLLPVIALSIAVLPAIRWIPEQPVRLPPEQIESTVPNPGVWRAVVALVGLTIWVGAPSAFWVFAADVAQAHHFSAAGIGSALAAGNAIGLLGAAVAAWQGNRWPRTGPILIGSACMVASIAAAQAAASIVMFAAMLAAFLAFWNYAVVYEMALVVALDRTGKVAAGLSGAQMAGFAIGAFAAGHAIVAGGYSILTPVASAFAVAGLLLFAVCRRRAGSVTAQLA